MVNHIARYEVVGTVGTEYVGILEDLGVLVTIGANTRVS